MGGNNAGKEEYLLHSKATTVEKCDTRNDDRSYTAGLQKSFAGMVEKFRKGVCDGIVTIC